MSHFEDFKNTIQNIWRYKIKNVPQIRLAVVGTPASGKSYQIYDIMRAYSCMGLKLYNLTRDGVAYSTPAQYETDVIRGGTLGQTPLYASRQENFYGAQCVKGRKEFDIDYLNIPGEVFNDANEVTFFFTLYDRINTSKKQFRVVTWSRASGDEVYVVEPLFGDVEELENARTNEEDIWTGFRVENYLPWGQIFAELRFGGFKPTKKRMKISGKKILANMQKFNADSVMNSIGTIASTLGLPGYNNIIDKRRFLIKFTFLSYCKNATDLVICDKMLVPEKDGAHVDEMTFGNLCTGLNALFRRNGKNPNVYLAFRGADFLVQEREDKYNAIRQAVYADPDIDMKSEEQRNAQYSVFAYAMWQNINAQVVVREDMKEVIGYALSDEDHDQLVVSYLNLNHHSGEVPDGGSIDNYISAHIGGVGGGMFLQLLGYSYPNLDLTLITSSLDHIVPHIYFTCTPITEDFLVYRNDPDSPYKYARFVTDKKQGAARYFDQCGSNLCFGSYQLALDILQQHGICFGSVNDLLSRCQATQ